MSLLQSALDFLAGPGSLGGAAGRDQSDFVGQTVELGELRLRVRRVLAEGEACAGRERRQAARGRVDPGRQCQRRVKSGPGRSFLSAGFRSGPGRVTPVSVGQVISR